MKFVIFGLTVSSSWGNGHATLWRGLWRALAERGHEIAFFEKDVPYYAEQRDLRELPGGVLHLYRDWDEVRFTAQRELANADVGMVTSYCPDGRSASELVLSSCACKTVFYDLDTPVTLSQVKAGNQVAYVPDDGLRHFDLVLSYTGGQALQQLAQQLGARRVAPLYGHVDPSAHYPVASKDSFKADLSYLGTYAADRQPAVEAFLIEPARRLPKRRFVIGGAQYPQAGFPWVENIFFTRHLAPSQHPQFFCSSRITLNVTRRAMLQMGFCPSGRLFEAAACGTPVLTDVWEGLEQFYRPGEEILTVRTTSDALDALELSDSELGLIGAAARERTLTEHTSSKRVESLERELQALWNEPHFQSQPARSAV